MRVSPHAALERATALQDAKAMASQNSGRLDQMPMQPNVDGDIVGPLSNDAIAPTELWEENSHRADLARRENCPWDASI